MPHLKYRVVFLSLLAACCLFISCNSNKRKVPQMYPAFLYRDKGPLGTNVAFRLLHTQFSAPIYTSSKSTVGYNNMFNYAQHDAYINIGKGLLLDSLGLAQVLRYVKRGNDFFMSGDVNSDLLDTLGMRTEYIYSNDSMGLQKRNTYLVSADTARFGKHQYGFFFYPMSTFFARYDTARTTVLGYTEFDRPNYIATQYGKGRFFIHLAPTAYSNYFLLTGNNSNYLAESFSYLNKNYDGIIWADTDQFGRKQDGFSALAIFWKYPMLRNALLIACTLLLLYIAFGSKRKRRLVPYLAQNENASLAFVKTIGNLYLQQKDNRNIAIKRINFFLEYVRSQYHLNTSVLNPEFIQALAGKTGVDETTIAQLTTHAEELGNVDAISDQQLLEINNLLEAFYNKR